MAGLVIGIALAIDLGRTRTVQTASQKAPVVVNDRDYAAGHGQLPLAHVGGALMVLALQFRDVDEEGRGKRVPEVNKLLVERLGLSERAGKSIKDESIRGIRLLEPLDDHRDDQVVRNQITVVHVLLGLLAELGPLADRLPEHVSRGYVRKTEVTHQAASLRTLPRPRWPEQDQVQLGHEAT